MPKIRYADVPVLAAEQVPFQSAEEAWFWYVRCQKARGAGMRMIRGMELTARPCMPDDIYRAVKTLAARRVIDGAHVRVLKSFGELERPPDPRCTEEASAYALWDQALDRLTSVLKAKEIVQ